MLIDRADILHDAQVPRAVRAHADSRQSHSFARRAALVCIATLHTLERPFVHVMTDGCFCTCAGRVAEAERVESVVRWEVASAEWQSSFVIS